jgi:acyl-CoA thioesterase FadM
MVHALFARGIVARTAELKVRYRHPAGIRDVLEVRAWLQKSFGPLHELESEIRSENWVVATARAKFMAAEPADADESARPDREIVASAVGAGFPGSSGPAPRRLRRG